MFPSVRLLLLQHNLSIASIKGSGPKQRVTKGDVLNYLQSLPASKSPSSLTATATATSTATPLAAAAPTAQLTPKAAKAPPASSRPFTDVPVSQIRKVIAARLSESKSSIPHGYVSAKVNVTSVAALRASLNASGSAKISFNDFTIKAVALALRSVPALNAQWDSKTSAKTVLPTVDVSVAVATESGLITPIVKDADRLDVAQISARVKDLADRAKTNKLKLNEFQGGSFTISNLGMYGIAHFSAVINPPQTCILAVAASQQELAMSPEPPFALRVQQTIDVTLSYDSRAVDESDAGLWLDKFKEYLETPSLLL